MGLSSKKLHVLSICAGIGGLELGVRLARPDAEVICYVEKKPFAIKILKQRIKDGCLDDAPIWDDLRTFDPVPWRGAVDCITAGYPCQSFSSAARGHHTESDLSGEVLRVIDGCRPSIVFIENVYHAWKSLANIRRELDRMGYHSPPLLDTRTSDVGGPHQRKRLFLLAHANGYRQPDLQVDAEVEGLSSDDGNVWQDYTSAIRMDDGIASRMDRLDVSGNAVVPLVAAYAWQILEKNIKIVK